MTPSLSIRRFFATLAVTFPLALLSAGAQSTEYPLGQVPPPKPGTGSVTGIVTDSAGNPLAGVLITIDDPKGHKHGELTTQGSGLYRFNDLDPTASFSMAFGRRGYAVEVRYGVSVDSNDERRVDVAMHKQINTLEAMKIIAAPPKGSSLAKKFLGSEEIAAANVNSAFDAIQRLRPVMLARHAGEMCMPPDTVLTLYVNGIRRPLFDPPDLSSLNNIGGGNNSNNNNNNSAQSQSHFATQDSAMHRVQDELSLIRAEDVLQVRYVSCEDFQSDIGHRNVIWVVLKPWAK